MAITLSTALFLSSNAISNSFTKTILEQLKSTYGTANIVVQPEDIIKTPWVSESVIKDDPRIKRVMGVHMTGGTYELEDEKISFSLFGADMDKLKEINSFEFLKAKDYEPFRGKKIVISEAFAKDYKFDLGDILSLKIKNVSFRFRVVAIAKTNALFGDESQRKMALVPKESLDEILETGGKSSNVYIEAAAGVNLPEFVEELEKDLKRYKLSVREAVSPVDIQQRTTNISVPFLMISILVVIMSVFIIYTSFKVITIERLPILGTFRSVGATSKNTRNVLLLESAIYGALGGVTGIPLGIIVLSIILKIFSSFNPRGMKIDMDITLSNVLISFALAFIISMVSAFIPIYKASKLPLKDLVLGTVEIKQSNKKKNKRLMAGIAIAFLSVLLPFVVPVNLVVSVGGLCILTLVSSMLYSTPFFVKVITLLLEGLYYRLFGNEGFIAVKNIKNNDNINQNVSLLIISISTLLLVSILSTTLQELVTNSFLGSNYQITTQGVGVESSFIKRINGLKSVDSTYPSYQASNVEIKNTKEKFRLIEGVNGISVLDFFDIPMKEGKVEPLLELLQTERSILVTDAMMLKLNAKTGDTILLDTKKGEKSYKIIGIMTLARSEAVVGTRFIKSDFELSNYGFVAVKSKDPEKAVLDIKDLYGGKNNFTSTIPELVNRVKSVFGVLFGILKGFSVVLLVIGIFGVMNNLIINFIQQRRAIAMFRSVGMSKIQLRKIAFIEAITAGIFGGVLGIVTTLLELVLVSKVLKNLFGVVPIEYPPLLFIGAFVIGITVTLIGSIVPGIKGQKLKIIEALKFE